MFPLIEWLGQRSAEVKPQDMHAFPEVETMGIGSVNCRIQLEHSAAFGSSLCGNPLQKCFATSARSRAGRGNQVVYLDHFAGSKHLDDAVACYGVHIAFAGQNRESKSFRLHATNGGNKFRIHEMGAQLGHDREAFLDIGIGGCASDGSGQLIGLAMIGPNS